MASSVRRMREFGAVAKPWRCLRDAQRRFVGRRQMAGKTPEIERHTKQRAPYGIVARGVPGENVGRGERGAEGVQPGGGAAGRQPAAGRAGRRRGGGRRDAGRQRGGRAAQQVQRAGAAAGPVQAAVGACGPRRVRPCTSWARPELWGRVRVGRTGVPGFSGTCICSTAHACMLLCPRMRI